MKKITALILTFALSLSVCCRSWGNAATEASILATIMGWMGTDISTKAEQGATLADQLWGINKQIAQNAENLENYRNLYGTVKNIYNLFDTTNDLAELMRNMETLVNLANAAYIDARSLYESRRISAAYAYQVIRTGTSYVARAAQQVQNVRKLILSDEFKATGIERLTWVQKTNKILEALIMGLRSEVYRMKQTAALAAESNGVAVVLDPTVDKITTYTQEELRRVAKGIAGTVIKPEDKPKDAPSKAAGVADAQKELKGYGGTVYNFVLLIVGMMSAIFITMNTIRRMKDEAYVAHKDALFVAMVGSIAALALLLIIKAIYLA